MYNFLCKLYIIIKYSRLNILQGQVQPSDLKIKDLIEAPIPKTVSGSGQRSV